MPNTVEGLERGVRGTEKTIRKMDKLVALGKLDPTMQKIATWIRLSVPEDYRGSTKETLNAVFNWVQKHKVFQRDPFQIEKIEHPIEAMRPVIEARRKGIYNGPGLFVGDCDTIAGVYLATLGGILGFQYSWETAKVDPGRPDEFSHIWTAFLLKGGEWYPLDPSTPGAAAGWRPPVSGDRLKRWTEKPIEDVLGMSGMNGHGTLNGLGYDPNGPMIPDDLFNAEFASRYYEGKINAPRIDGGDLDVHIPPDNALSQTDMDPRWKVIRREPTPRPQERPMQISPEDDYKPSPNYYPRRPYTHIDPAGGSAPQYPYANQVEVLPGEPMVVHRREREVIRRPVREQGMSGMGQDSPFIFTYADAAKEAEKASTSTSGTLDSIISGIAKAIPSLAQSTIDAVKAKYQAAVASAQAKVIAQTQASGTTPGGTPLSAARPKSWYENPLVWAGGVVVIGGVAYALSK